TTFFLSSDGVKSWGEKQWIRKGEGSVTEGCEVGGGGVGGGEWERVSSVGCRVSGVGYRSRGRLDAGSTPTPHPQLPTPYFVVGRTIALIAASTFSVRFDVPPVVS